MVKGVTVAGFNPSTLTYNVVLHSGSLSTPMVTATTTDANATKVIANATTLPGATTVVVTANDGTTQKTYTINFTVAAMTDATLTDLQVDGIEVSGFDPATYTYNVELPYGTTVVPTVTATAYDTRAVMVISKATLLPGATNVDITANDGTTRLSYTVNFSIAQLSTDATLSNIKVDDTIIAGFSSDTLTYNVELPYGTTVIPQVSASVTDTTATCVVNDAAALPGSTTIVVTAQDGTTKETYTVNFTIAIQTFTVTFNVVNGNGAISATVDTVAITSTATVNVGDDVVFAAIPADGYIVKEWKLNNAVITGNLTNNYTLSNISENSSVTVEFELVTGINEINDVTLNVYPIPARDKVNIKSNANINRIILVNTNGQMLLQTVVNSQDVILNTTELRNGTYFLRIVTDKGVIIRKIQISR